MADAVPDTDTDGHRAQAVAANTAAWEILDGGTVDADGGDALLAAAHAAAFHWARAADRVPANDARASWLLSRCYVVLGHGALALHHAERCAATCAAAALVDFDLAYAHEARARALACLGDHDAAAVERARAGQIEIVDAEDQDIFSGDLASEPWFGLST